MSETNQDLTVSGGFSTAEREAIKQRADIHPTLAEGVDAAAGGVHRPSAD